MRTVEDDAGRRYLLLKRSGASSLVRDLDTGERRHLPNARLTHVDGADPLLAGAPAGLRERLPDGLDDRALGLLVALEAGPLPARAVLSATELCESDLLGLVSELRAAGLLCETTADGEPGYALTGTARAALGDQSARASSSVDPD